MRLPTFVLLGLFVQLTTFLASSLLNWTAQATEQAATSNVALIVPESAGMATARFCGALSFTSSSFSVVRLPESVVAGDFNGDGRLDLAATGPTTDDLVSVLLGDGTGAFGGAANFRVGGMMPSTGETLAAGDFNRDGTLDLAIATVSGISILLGNGAGGFGGPRIFPAGSAPSFIAVADLNGDGNLDLAVANRSSNTVSVLLGNGVGGFGPATNFAVGPGPVSIAVADLSRDGKPDLVVANFGSPPLRDSNTISVLLGNGAGGFGAATNFAVGHAPHAVAVGDLNGDGRLDVVVANFGWNPQFLPYDSQYDGSVSVLLGNGAGGFGAATQFATGLPKYDDFGHAVGPTAVAVGDFDADGKLDVATANYGDNAVSILLGDGAGGLRAAMNLGLDGGPWSIAVGDFNGDGKLDLGVALSGSNSVGVLLNTCTPPTITLSPTTLVGGSVGGGYSQSLSATGGTGPHAFAVTSGALPIGLSLSSTGLLSGTPSVAGTYSFVITATDTDGFTGSQAYSVRVLPFISVDPVSGPVGTSVLVSASGFPQCLAFNFQFGFCQMPNSTNVSFAGTFIGAGVGPAVTTAFSVPNLVPGAYPVTVNDRTGLSVSAMFTVTAPTITLNPATLPAGRVGGTYVPFFGASIGASGGTAPYGFSVSGGAVPPGLSLSSSGRLAGVPTTAGSFSFTVVATDANGFTGSQAYTITVATAPTTTTLVASANPSLFGQTVTFTATVADGALTPNGSVTFSDGATTLGTANLSAGQASLGVASLAVGSHTVSAVYNPPPGATSFASSSAALTQVVNVPNTPTGTGVTVRPVDPTTGTTPVGLIFSSVTGEGSTLVTSSTTGPAAPSGFLALNTYYDITTTAAFAPPITVCVSYPAGSALPRLFHYENGAWRDVTNPNGVDTVAHIVCGDVSTLSPFGVFVSLVQLSPSSLSDGTFGVPYGLTVAATGGTGPYGFAVSAGVLPAGLSLSSGGVLGGTPAIGGTFSFTVTATDANGFTGTRPYSLLVMTPPAITAPANVTTSADAGRCSAVVNFAFTAAATTPGATITSIVSTPSSGAAFPRGTTTVTGTATDSNGLTAAASFTVTVNDAEPPAISAPASITRSTDPGKWFASAVSLGTPIASDNCPGVTIAALRSDGRPLSDPYPLAADGTSGRTTITYTATDASGNTASAIQTVTVEDHERPTLSAPANVVTTTAPGACSRALSYAFAATDNSGRVTVSGTPAPGSAFPRGATTVTGTATDPTGNTTTASFTVTVNDAEEPTISAPSDITVLADGASGTVVTALGTPAFADNCPGVTASVSLLAGNLFPIGVTTLTWTATDASGNAASATQTVTVRYKVCLLYDPTRPVQAGSTVPMKLQLCSASSGDLSSSKIAVHAVALTNGTVTLAAEASGNANPGNDFRAVDLGYIYNLGTKGLPSGSWKLLFTAAGQTYDAPFQIK